MRFARLISRHRLFLLSSILGLLASTSPTILVASYPAVIAVGPLNTAPAYFYIDTKIPFNDTPAPQLQLSGYNYGQANHAVKLTLGWYVYQNAFYWSQLKSDLGYYNPSRIRLGTYDDSGTTRVRIEIANDGTYWSSYYISATDHNGVTANYQGWSYATGAFPSGTANIVTVQEYAGITYDNTGKVGIGTNSPTNSLSVHNAGSTGGTNGFGAANTVSQGIFSIGSEAKDLGPSLGFGSANKFSGGTSPYLYGVIRGAKESSTATNDYAGYLAFYTQGASSVTDERLRITSTGNVGIGTTNPGSYKLAVAGTIRAYEVIVNTGWSDYVFADDYRLAPLSEVEAHIKAEKHLPGIPSAAEIAQGGISLGDMQSKLLAKVEELTLHVIAQNKRLDEQSARLAALEQENHQLRTR